MVHQAVIRQATQQDVPAIANILSEAAQWLDRSGMSLWRLDELAVSAIAGDVAAGLFFLAEDSSEAAGTLRFQLEDPVFWPDLPQGEAAYIHRLAVRRRYAGTGLSAVLMKWAAQRTLTLGRRVLRLDCEESRTRLRHVYESFGFVHHSDRQVGPYFVARYEYDLTGVVPLAR